VDLSAKTKPFPTKKNAASRPAVACTTTILNILLNVSPYPSPKVFVYCIFFSFSGTFFNEVANPMAEPYPHYKQFAYRYTFTSVGKERIEKMAIFSTSPIENLYNFGFGDLMHDGSIDHRIRSNNGDLIRVLATVINIIKTSLKTHPSATVFFVGSTPTRTDLYRRILKTHYNSFSNDFIISALIEDKNNLKETPFDPISPNQYLGFLIKLSTT
jgi:hypothetical protein